MSIYKGTTLISGVSSSSLPSQTGHAGEYLTTNGETPSWNTINVDRDDLSITLNTLEKLQAVGIINQNNNNEAIKTWTGTLADYNALATKNPTTLYNITDDTITQGLLTNASGHNIGEVIYSLLPIVDSGYKLLDGSLIDGTGIYHEFYEYLVELQTGGTVSSVFTDETSWQNSVATYGVCGKFVLDTSNQTVRLPKITGMLEGTIDANALGQLTAAGLPNITGTVMIDPFNANCNAFYGLSGAFYETQKTSGAWASYASAGEVATNDVLNLNASRSSSIYGNSTTVQPQTIKGYYYMIVSNSTKEAIQVDVDEIANDLDNKANKNLSNTPIVNCITYIPNRITAEISSGSLVIKSGSVIIVPKSAGVYQEVTLTSDLTASIGFSGSYTDVIICYNNTTGTLGAFRRLTTETKSGTDGTLTIGYYYNTSTNQVRYYTSGTASTDEYSFPLVKLQNTASVLNSIIKVYNQATEIGSTMVIYPGIKGLVPNGKNADGSNKNLEITNTSYIINTYDYQAVRQQVAFGVSGNWSRYENYIISTKQPTANYTLWYNPETNILMGKGSGSYSVTRQVVVCDSISTDATSFVITDSDYVSVFSPTDLHNAWNYKHPGTQTDRASKYKPSVVIDSYKNGTNWYRIWSDGWVEQGGRFTSADAVDTTVTFIIPMRETTYQPMVGQMYGSSGSTTYWNWAVYSTTTTSMVIHNATNGDSNYCIWQVSGMGSI